MSEMTIERAAEVLKAHNAWRRGDAETYGDSKLIGIAIDVAVRELEKITGGCDDPEIKRRVS
jgi:hypothetical protein